MSKPHNKYTVLDQRVADRGRHNRQVHVRAMF